MKTRALFVILVLGLVAAGAAAEPGPGDDPMRRLLFPPDKVLAHAHEIGLDEAQRTSIRGELQKAQTKFLDIQFELQAQGEKMAQLLQEKPVDETKVLAQADRVMSLERDAKKTQLSLLVRIKNLLTAEQQSKMTELQKAEGK